MMRGEYFLLIFFSVGFGLQAVAETHGYYDSLGKFDSSHYRSMNLSSFIFMDIDRDGRYSQGDRPMPGIHTTLHYKDREISKIQSNENGFSNFEASKDKPQSPIKEKGFYTFKVHPPHDWRVTTNNDEQSRELIDIPGSLSGTGFVEMMKPVGLASPLFIRGRALPDTLVILENSNDQNDKQSIMTGPDGTFKFNVESGDYILAVQGDEISVPVKNYPVDIGSFKTPAFAPSGSSDKAYVIDFDDISDTGIRKVANGYGGLDWFNFNSLRSRFSNKSVGYINGNVSEDYIAYSSSGHPAYIYAQDDKGFNFHSVYVSVSWPKAEGEMLMVEAWRGDEKVSTDQVTLSAFGPVLYKPEIANITKIRFSTKHYWQLVMDDLTVSQ